MRLIDADALKEELYQEWFMDILLAQRHSEDIFYALAQKIDEQPTAYDLEKIVECLNKDSYEETADDMSAFEPPRVVNLRSAIEIVKNGGKEKDITTYEKDDIEKDLC